MAAFGEGEYQRAVNRAVRGLWAGQGDYYWFVDAMVSAIRRGFQLAWDEGESTYGITPAEWTQEEKNRLDLETNTEIGYVLGLADAVWNGRKETGGKLTPLLGRATMWGNKYGNIRSIAMTYAGADQKMKWGMNPLKEHCSGCLKLDGRVYRGSVWRRWDIYPRMRRLPCGGHHCGCTLTPTILPITPGRPPNI